MTAVTLVPYRKAQVPTLQSTLSDDERLYYDLQLAALQKAIASLNLAIVQLQKSVQAASAFPIVLA